MESAPKPWDVLDHYRGSVFTGEWPTLPELFEITASRYPDRPCFTVYSPERITLTYGEVLVMIKKVARYLRSAGITHGDRVALSGTNSPQWAAAYLGTLAAGAVVVPIDYQLTNHEIEKLISASGSKALFIDEEKFEYFSAGRFRELTEIISLSRKHTHFIYDLRTEDDFLITPAGENDLAAILYTSGTTGTPKGVMLTHRNFVSDCFLAQGNLNIFPGDVFYALLPLHHSYSMLAVFIESISVGAEIVFGKKMIVKQILSDLKDAGVTMFLGVPLLFNKLLAGIMRGVREKGFFVYAIIRSLLAVSGLIKKLTGRNPGKRMFQTVLDKASLTSIRICISGGGPLAPSVFRRYNQFGIDFVQGYGLTETSPILALNPVDHYKETSVGRVIEGADVRILDPDTGGAGEIAVKGPMVMQGYYNLPEETAEVFTEDGYFKTGDVGYLDDENYLYLTGRAKNMIVTEGGKNVYPEELENCFQLYEAVEQVMIRGFRTAEAPDAEQIEALLYPNQEYYTQQSESEPMDWSSIEKHLRQIVSEVNHTLLPYQKIVRVTILREPMEMTTTKKIKRFAVDEKQPA